MRSSPGGRISTALPPSAVRRLLAPLGWPPVGPGSQASLPSRRAQRPRAGRAACHLSSAATCRLQRAHRRSSFWRPSLHNPRYAALLRKRNAHGEVNGVANFASPIGNRFFSRSYDYVSQSQCASPVASKPDKTKPTQNRERRKGRRSTLMVRAKILYANLRSRTFVMDSVILNISEGGARPRPADTSSCPIRFALQLHGKRIRDCEVIWRNQGVLGVRYVSSWRASNNRDKVVPRRNRS